MSSAISINRLGWQAFFQQQLHLEELEHASIARVCGHHRNGYLLHTIQGTLTLHANSALPEMTLGDWLLLDEQQHFVRLLERKSLFKRKAAGTRVTEQLIAANVDTLFIVCSLNQDFNLSRIERYLALAHEATVTPVVVLTKQDLCADVEDKRQAVQALDPFLQVETVNALDKDSCSSLLAYCGAGQTLSLLGSSGVGKSTLVNSLLGYDIQKTATIREDDSKGRHTTTARTMHFLPSGAVLIDTPGMRELQLTECETGVRQTFADIEQLAQQCRFNDCQHQSEPGCTIQQAIATGELEPRRLSNYLKLLAEQAHNSASLQQRHAQDRQFGRMVKTVSTVSRKLKKGY
ncbi:MULTISPECIES: ribosome small subunit-dependent GTPase A [Shewanella]|uniref:ribosome small subunit-dependent GTPase A n=1 Tax=Shewanella TaxID=22 RepID=UPI0016772B7E|nr:ribosome small subunit-dependent GTPase A [Shewanella fodinae]MCL2906865.1 ribosome small subunit-dependent GTPase A [Shewanella fodinae]GGZ04128.1 putative ribosome biogenesis GTPase RsgA 2 [Shewanella fodinae]